jgi:hypothetical protein
MEAHGRSLHLSHHMPPVTISFLSGAIGQADCKAADNLVTAGSVVLVTSLSSLPGSRGSPTCPPGVRMLGLAPSHMACMLLMQAAEVADVSDEVHKISRAWQEQQTGAPEGVPAASSSPRTPPNTAARPMGRAASSVPLRGPTPAVRSAEWEDIAPPVVDSAIRHGLGGHGQVGHREQSQTRAAMHQVERGGSEKIVADSARGQPVAAGISPTGWEEVLPDRGAGPVNAEVLQVSLRLPSGGAIQAAAEGSPRPQVPRAGFGGGGSWAEVPAFGEHDMSRRAPASPRVDPGVMTRRPFSANNHRLAASVLASVVGARQREAGQAGRGRTTMGASPEKVGGGGGIAQERREVRGEGAAQPMEEFERRGGGDGRTRGPSGLLRGEEDRNGRTVGAGNSISPQATGWDDDTVQESALQVRGGPSEQEGGATEGAGAEGEFWTLGSPPTQPPPRDGNHEAPRNTWDTTWPSSAVAGRTNWDQQPRADSANGRAGRIPTTINALEPPSSAPAHDPEPPPSSEYASSGWSGQPRTAGSGSISVSQQSSRGRASSGQSVQAPQKPRYEVINARAVTPPDVSTLLSKPSTLAVRPLPLSLATSEQLAQKVTVRPQPRIEPAAGVQVIQPRAQEGAVIHVSEGSGSGRVLPVSMPLIPLRNTADSLGASRLQPAMASSVDAPERETNRQSAPQPRTSSLSEVPSASKGSPQRPDVRAGLSRAVSSVSSTGSTSNSKPAWKVRKEAGPQPISLGVFPEVGPTGWDGAQGQTGGGAHDDSSEQLSGDRRGVVAEGSGSEEAKREGAREMGDWAQQTEAMWEPPRAEAQATVSERSGAEQAAQEDDRGTASVESVQGSQVEALSPGQVAEARAAQPESQGGGEAPPPEPHADSGCEREAGEEPDSGAEQSEERGEAGVQDADPPAGVNTPTAPPSAAREIPVAWEAPVGDASPPQPAPEQMKGQISGVVTAGAPSLLPVRAAEAVSAAAARRLLERSTPLRAEAKVFVAGVGLVEDAHSPAAATGRRPGGTAGEPGERPDGRGNEEEQRVGPKGSGGKSRVRKWASETSEEEQRQGEREPAMQAEHQGAFNGHQLEGGGPLGWENASHADTEERPTGWQSASHVNAGLQEERPFAMKGAWGDAAPPGVRPWSEEAPRRPQKQTPSGSWVSEDSGSVRSVSIDVERWAEEAARTTLCEHEAMLEDSPVGFEGAASGGSGRGGSRGSSRAGSSEGGGGGGRGRYRLKMQKFQLAAIKANQTGGGPPTGWEAVPEEGADEGGLLPAYVGQQGKGCVDNHLGVSSRVPF